VNRPPVVDAHQHFWDPAAVEYPWMTEELAPIRRRFMPEDLRPLLRETGVDRTVLVQTRSSIEETRAFLALAESSDFVAGVVGWVDLAGPDVAAAIHGLRSGPGGGKLVGIRHQVHDEPDAGWLLGDEVQRGLRAVQDAGLAYDLLVRTRELGAALETVRRHPELRFVIDHIAKPPIESGEVESWAEAMAPFAEEGNVSCKLSGMVTEADWARWTPEDLRPYVQRVLSWFGADRLLFGSDWPVCLLAASYKEVYEACLAALGDLPQQDRTKIVGENAVRFYRLEL